MQPLCNLLAVAVSDHQSRDILPSRPSPDSPPRAMAGRDDRQAGALSAACPARPSPAASVSSSDRHCRCDRSEPQWTF
jgi:hypothetical protein